MWRSVKQGFASGCQRVFFDKMIPSLLKSVSTTPSSRTQPAKTLQRGERPQQALELMIGSLVGMVQAGRTDQARSR
jgi:hypothetical protein